MKQKQKYRPEFDKGVFNCSLCYLSFPIYKLFHHHAICYNGLIKTCNQFKIITKKTGHLTKHIEKDHLEVKFICDACDYTVERKRINKNKINKQYMTNLDINVTDESLQQ